MAAVSTAVAPAVSPTFSAVATTCEVSRHVLYLFGSSLASLQYATLEVQRLTCQRVVQVHLHLFLAHGHHSSVESLSFLVLQRNYGILVDMLVVEVSVDTEYLAV